jgi:hypothetical protein
VAHGHSVTVNAIFCLTLGLMVTKRGQELTNWYTITSAKV